MRRGTGPSLTRSARSGAGRFRQHRRGIRPCRRGAQPHRRSVSRTSPASATTTALQAGAARHGGTACGALECGLPGHGAVPRASMRCIRAAAALGVDARAAATGRAHPFGLRACRGETRDRMRGASYAELMQQLARLTTRRSPRTCCTTRRRSRWRCPAADRRPPSRIRRRRGRARRRPTPRPGRRAGDHAVALADRALPDLLGPRGPAPNRPGAPGSAAARTRRPRPIARSCGGESRATPPSGRMLGFATYARPCARRQHGAGPRSGLGACSDEVWQRALGRRLRASVPNSCGQWWPRA